MDEYKLHPKDNEFITTLYSINNNSNTSSIYYSLYNSIKKRCSKSLLELLLNIINKVEDNTSIQLFNNIISYFRYDNFEYYNIELKLITNSDILNLIKNNHLLLKYYDHHILSYYEILIYTQTKYNTDITEFITIDDINWMTDLYINHLHNLEYNENRLDYKILFAIYHINYINKRDDFNFNDNKNYHILFLYILKFINNPTISFNNFKFLFNNISHTAKWINNILQIWINTQDGIIDLTTNNYLEYQNEIICFLSLCSYDKLNSYYDNDIPDNIIECFSSFQSNLYKLINNNTILNIYSKCKIIELNHNNNAWNNINNITELIRFYINLEKYTNSTGFDSRDKIRFFISKILVGIIANGTDINNIINDQILLYKFMVLLINDNYKNIEFIKNYSLIYDDTETSLLDSIQIEFHTISMLVTSKMIILFHSYLIDKWFNYITYDIILWWNSNINLFVDEDVQFFVTDMIDNGVDLLKTSKKNIADFIQGFINFSNDIVNNSIIYNEWIKYSNDNKDNINKFIDYITDDLSYTINNNLKNKITNFTDLSSNFQNIPDEFLDPIVYELIENPVEIPITNIIVDEKFILKHIILKNDNPFNRDPLIVEEFLKYQERDDVKIRIAKWLDNYNKWLLK